MSFKVSIIIPCYNEEDNLKDFYCGIKKTLLELPYSYEIIFVNDGSNDNSSNLLDEIKTKDNTVKAINLAKRNGQLNAYLAGFDYAKGEIIITMDADGQHEPNDISAFIKKINAGFDFVSGHRVDRKDPFYRKALSLIASYLISAKVRIKLHDWGCGFNAFNRNLIFSPKTYKQNKIFLIKPLLASMANSVGEINIAHYPRQKGNSKYNILSIIKCGLKFLLNGAVNQGEGKMRKTQIGCILLIMFIFSSINNLKAEPINKNEVKNEAITAFTQYCLALRLEDYDWAFSLEPRFIQ
ncbi:MAG: glycosyltransferase family 2 protein [Candidatus Omnitrophota bacterium]